ncbi:MAG: aspartate kinase [Pseudomonadota bacterium]
MARPDLVLKFGGTSMADPQRIAHSAGIVAHEAASGRGVAVVVSAMSGETDRLLREAAALGGALGEAETDAALAAGEQASSALMALALKQRGHDARAFAAWQIPIEVDGVHGAARVTAIDPAPLRAAIAAGVIPVIAGYQGVTPDGRIATLGRGGTDLTAAAVAAALGAECDIYTDVDGVFTTDPRIAPEARRLDRVSADEMLELAAMGAKVLQTRSVEYAKAKGVVLRVKSSFAEPGQSRGTEVAPVDVAERRIVSGVAYVRDQARLSLCGLEPYEGAAEVFASLAEAEIGIDMIVQTGGSASGARLEFSVDQRDLERAGSALNALGVAREQETGLAKVSVVGSGLRGRADVARTLYGVLARERVAVRMVATSEIKISALVDSDVLERAVRALHAAYKLNET